VFKYLNNKFKDLDAVEVMVKRQPAFSIGLAVEFIRGMAKGAGEVVGKALAEAIADWIQETYHDVDIIQLHLKDDKYSLVSIPAKLAQFLFGRRRLCCDPARNHH
jgi:hypothetical protein